MSEPIQYFVAITTQEWLNWIENGELRCSARIHQLSSIKDHAGIQRLIERGPDFSLKADDAIVVARLSKPADPEGQLDQSIHSVNARVPLENVIEFFPLSARGHKLLSGDARRAMVRLGEPHFEPAFEEWRSNERTRRLHEQGIKFVHSAGFDAEELNEQTLAGLRAATPRKPASFAKIERKRNRVYFGWAIALANICEHVGAEHWQALRRSVALDILLKELETQSAVGVAIAVPADVRKCALQIREQVKARLGSDCFPCRDSVIAHWTDRLELADGAGFERENELLAFGRDLRVVEADEGLNAALIAAYTVGLAARREIVQQLFYASRADRFTSLMTLAPTAWLGDRVDRYVVNAVDELSDVAAAGTDLGTAACERRVIVCALEEQLSAQSNKSEADIDAADRATIPAATPLPSETAVESEPRAVQHGAPSNEVAASTTPARGTSSD